MNVLLVRHGIAMDREGYHREYGEEASDDFRPLTFTGINKMRKNAKGLAKICARPQAIATSPLTRARETAQLLAEAWKGLPIATCESMRPDAPASELVSWFKNHFELESNLASQPVVLTGHNPHISSLLNWFLSAESRGGRREDGSSAFELKKGGAAFIKFAGLPQKNRGELVWMLTPRLMRQLAR